MKSFLLICQFICLTEAISNLEMKQLKGIQNLMKNLHNGVFTTCNIVFFSDLVDFNTAQENCRKFDVGTGSTEGNLATVNTDKKNEDLKMLLSMTYPREEQPKSDWADTKWVWSGLRKTRDNVGEGSKEMVYEATEWQWADGSTPGDFARWLPGQPDQNSLKKGKKGCTEDPKCYQNQMRINHDGNWDDTFKFKKHPYACDYQGKYILSSEKKSWEDAKTACDDAGLQLAKIRTDEELNEIMSAIQYFLGSGDESWSKWDANNWLWLGGNDIKKEKKWMWVDGEKIEWNIPWEKKAGNDNSKKKMKEGQDAMSLSRWGTIDDSFRLGIFRPFACQCPGS
ncbi:macrophage mannose receptor 1-like [Bolinopsis microptera]|uniref:macrophage mannose receptor 1-like n=1 Tax=Bolinopsis microptera TaxID=2820187 RepID=UPI00307B064D